MSIWPLHCRRHFSFCPVTSYSVRAQSEFTVVIAGPKVLPISAVCSAVRQRALTCGGSGAPLIMVLVVTFHCPAAIRSSAAAGAVHSANPQNDSMQNLFIGALYSRLNGFRRIHLVAQDEFL